MGRVRMGKKRTNVPDWCVALSSRLASRCVSSESVIEAIMFDVEMMGEDYAKRKWTRIVEEEKR